jgi:hypothetical protein
VELANRLDPSAADGPVDYAANVTAPLVGALLATAAALSAGEASVDHTRVIATTMAALPAAISVEQARAAEADLAGYARQFDPATLARLGRHLIHVLDTDTLAEREQRAFRRRELRMVDLGDGLTRLSGQLDAESAALVRSALDPLAAPNPAADGTPDPRSAGQRMADALVELAHRGCAAGDLPAGHGVPPHIALIVSLGTLQASKGRQPGAGPACGWTPTPPGELVWGAPLSAEAVRRIGCDAGISPIITDPASVPLDVGREQRTVTAHHIVHWADGGPTDLDNLVLLCGHHHRTIHHDGWDVRMAADRHPEFIPPSWINPDRTPQRSTRPRYDRASPIPDG